MLQGKQRFLNVNQEKWYAVVAVILDCNSVIPGLIPTQA